MECCCADSMSVDGSCECLLLRAVPCEFHAVSCWSSIVLDGSKPEAGMASHIDASSVEQLSTVRRLWRDDDI